MKAKADRLWVGTSGWYYNHWIGRFYPEDLDKKDWLDFYCRHFSTVEINATFYRMPFENMVRGWASRAPEGFRYAVKGNRRITHLKKLVGVDEDLRDYFRRIESIDFAVKHDDGAGLDTLDQADIVLVGVSRASKTPLSVYLSYRGWKVANVPFVAGLPLPSRLDEIDQRRIVALVVNPSTLQAIRRERERNLGKTIDGYTDIRKIREEMLQAKRVFDKKGWPVLDATQKSIEESATEIMRIIYARTHPEDKEEPRED